MAASPKAMPATARRTDEGSLVLLSEVLGLELRAEGSALRWVDPRTGEPLPTPPELHAVAEKEKKRAESEKKRAEREKERAEREKERAESEKERAESEKERAESEKKRAESEKKRAESEKRRADAAEAELARLREGLERQRGSRKDSG